MSDLQIGQELYNQGKKLTFIYTGKDNLEEFRKGIYRIDLVTTEINYFTFGSLYVNLLLELFYKIFPNFHKSKFQKNWKFNRFFF